MNSALSSSLLSSSSPRAYTAATPTPRPLQAFIEELHGIGIGPLAELEGRLLEAKALHAHALRINSSSAEREALAKVESCARQASAAAALANRRLQALCGEVNEAPPGTTEANLRRQSFTGECVRYQSLVNQLFQAQQEFKTQMEAKVRRQLRAHEPEEVLAGVLARAPQQQRGCAPDAASMTWEAMEENNSELLMLARAADDLRHAFMDMESLVSVQGERLDEVEVNLSRTQGRTRAAQAQLVQASEARRRCHVRWCILATIFMSLIVVLVVILIERGK